MFYGFFFSAANPGKSIHNRVLYFLSHLDRIFSQSVAGRRRMLAYCFHPARGRSRSQYTPDRHGRVLPGLVVYHLRRVERTASAYKKHNRNHQKPAPAMAKQNHRSAFRPSSGPCSWTGIFRKHHYYSKRHQSGDDNHYRRPVRRHGCKFSRIGKAVE